MFIYNGTYLVTNLVRVKSDYTLLLTDDIVLVDASGGAVIITLLNPSLVLANRAVSPFNIKKIDASANAVTVSSAQNIDGAATFSLAVQYQSLTVSIDDTGATYFIL